MVYLIFALATQHASFSFDGGDGKAFVQSLSSQTREAIVYVESRDASEIQVPVPDLRIAAGPAPLCDSIHKALGESGRHGYYYGFNQNLTDFLNMARGIGGMLHPTQVYDTGVLHVQKGYVISDAVARMPLSALTNLAWQKKLVLHPLFEKLTIDVSAKSRVHEETFIRCLAEALGGQVTETETEVKIVPDYSRLLSMCTHICEVSSKRVARDKELSADIAFAAQIYSRLDADALRNVYEKKIELLKPLEMDPGLQNQLDDLYALSMGSMNKDQIALYENRVDKTRPVYNVRPFMLPIVGFAGKDGGYLFI